MTKTVIFVGGTAYSGSTMLDMMLAHGDTGFSMGEVRAFFHPYRSHHRDPPCGCGKTDCTIWPTVKMRGEDRLYEGLFDCHPRLKFIVDSSKNVEWIARNAESLQASGIGVKHVLIWKDPVAYAWSRFKRGKAKNWDHVWIEYHRKYFSSITDVVSVSCAELSSEPAQVLPAVCQRLGLDYFPGKEQYWKGDHHTLFGNASAKVHLYDPATENYQKLKEDLRSLATDAPSPIVEGEHQTIYREGDVGDKLPEKIRKRAETDRRLTTVLRLLEETSLKTGPDGRRIETLLKKVRFSPIEGLWRAGLTGVKTMIRGPGPSS